MKQNAKEIVAKKLDELMRNSIDLGSQQKLANRTGIGQTTIGRIRRGEVNATAENLKAIAEAFDVAVGYLYGETDKTGRMTPLQLARMMHPNEANFEAWLANPIRLDGALISRTGSAYRPSLDDNTQSVITKGKLPLISWIQAGAWSDIVDNFSPGDAEDWIPCPFNHGPSAFILRVVGSSMYNPGGDKSYAPGEFIAVDPSAEPMNKKMVVARVDHEEKATFKQLIIDSEGEMMLQALNPSYVPRLMTMPPGSRIVGVVIGKWVPE